MSAPRINLLRVERVTVICGMCEAEWDADERPAEGPCRRGPCTFYDDQLEENVIRVDSLRPYPRHRK